MSTTNKGGLTPTQEKEYDNLVQEVSTIHPAKVSRILALCVSGVPNVDIRSLTLIPENLIEIVVSRVISDDQWLSLKGEVTNANKVTYDILRIQQVSNTAITEVSLANKADTVVNNTLDFLVDITGRAGGLRSISEAHNTLRSMASLQPILSTLGRLNGKDPADADKLEAPVTLVQQAIQHYHVGEFENKSHPIVNRESQVIGVEDKDGAKSIEIMPRRDLDALAENQASTQANMMPDPTDVLRNVKQQFSAEKLHNPTLDTASYDPLVGSPVSIEGAMDTSSGDEPSLHNSSSL